MPKNNYIRFGVTLFIICLIASGLLSSVYSVTKDNDQAAARRNYSESFLNNDGDPLYKTVSVVWWDISRITEN